MGGRPIIHTVNGHELGDVVSAFQKSVRRGLLDDALYYAVDLDLSNYGEYVWSRILVITSEDIGLAEPQLPATIRALYDTWKQLKAKKNDHHPERLMLIHAVTLLSTATKSRLLDHATLYHYGAHERLKREIPDWIYDGHTRRGKRAGRGTDYFFTEGTKLFPEAGQRHDLLDYGVVHDPYRKLAWQLLAEGEPGQTGLEVDA